ncbi:branched-chain amino acid ABC transporter permease [Neobacillus sp. SAB-20_R2A]|uniref:branched-chain amino acid ABC transporter permease n=1 Tax=Neobacillus sp. SAB-20_R2A TaxID=3120519 RepID=UPI003C6E1164
MFWQQLVNGIVDGGIYVLIGIGLMLVFGTVRIPNFAHGELYMVGAFISYFLITLFHFPIFIAFLVSALGVSLIGIFKEKLVFRPLRNAPELSLLISSIAVIYISESVASLLWGEQSRSIPVSFSGKLEIGSVTITYIKIFIIVITLVTIFLLHLFINKTTTGRSMRALAQNKNAAALMGIDIDKITSITFGIGSALAAMSGTLVALLFPIDVFMGSMASLKAFTVIILAGLGNIPGTIGAGLLLGISENLGAAYIDSAYKNTFAFILLIIILIIRPGGLFGKRGVLRD